MSTITMNPPSRSRQQRLAALKVANDTRSRRARLKEQLHAADPPVARAQVAGLLTDTPPVLETMKVYDLLLAQPKVGRVKTSKILSRARLSPSKTVGGLSDRQRAELVELLRG